MKSPHPQVMHDIMNRYRDRKRDVVRTLIFISCEDRIDLGHAFAEMAKVYSAWRTWGCILDPGRLLGLPGAQGDDFCINVGGEEEVG